MDLFPSFSELSTVRLVAHATVFQIDLVIRRADRVVNLCEMKFCSEKFTLDDLFAF